jgi:hypothetical protein
MTSTDYNSLLTQTSYLIPQQQACCGNNQTENKVGAVLDDFFSLDNCLLKNPFSLSSVNKEDKKSFILSDKEYEAIWGLLSLNDKEALEFLESITQENTDQENELSVSDSDSDSDSEDKKPFTKKRKATSPIFPHLKDIKHTCLDETQNASSNSDYFSSEDEASDSKSN